MKTFTIFIISAILLSSCASSLSINKKLETSTNKIEIKTSVDNYKIGKSKFYGSITTKNNTNDTLIFNFNQAIIISGDTIRADYNIKPVSYAMQAFYIYPNSSTTWNVVWNYKQITDDYSELVIVADTNFSNLEDYKAYR